jgi:hypothetical protein
MLDENHVGEKEGVIDTLFEKTKDYVETRADLFRLKAIKKTAEVGSSIVSKIIVAVVFSSFFIFLNIAIALLLGDLIGKLYIGFFIVAAFYLIVGILIYSNRQKIISSPLADSIIKKMND